MAIEKTCSTATKIPGSRISFQKLKDCRLAGERLIADAQPAGCGTAPGCCRVKEAGLLSQIVLSLDTANRRHQAEAQAKNRNFHVYDG